MPQLSTLIVPSPAILALIPFSCPLYPLSLISSREDHRYDSMITQNHEIEEGARAVLVEILEVLHITLLFSAAHRFLSCD